MHNSFCMHVTALKNLFSPLGEYTVFCVLRTTIQNGSIIRTITVATHYSAFSLESKYHNRVTKMYLKIG